MGDIDFLKKLRYILTVTWDTTESIVKFQTKRVYFCKNTCLNFKIPLRFVS